MFGMACLGILAVNTMLVLIASVLVVCGGSSAAGSGIPEIKSFLNGIRMRSWLSGSTLLSKIAGVIFSVSSGLPVGNEGPMIHSGAIIASLTAQGFSKTKLLPVADFSEDNDVRDFVSCGAAAGEIQTRSLG